MNILVNKEQWDSLSQDEQSEIIKGLETTGVMGRGDQIVGDPSVQAFDENTQLEPMWNPIKDPIKGVCKAACDAAAAAGVAWCTANTAGVGLAACLAAAEAARRECRRRC